MSTTESLTRLRTEPLAHWVGLLLCTLLGLGLASVHWLGLVAGGALVGLVTTSFRRALLAGLGFGVVVVLVWSLLLLFGGALGKIVATGQLWYISVLIGIGGPVLGSLVRGII